MTGPMLHTVDVDSDARTIYEAITTKAGEAAFWTSDLQTSTDVGGTQAERSRHAATAHRMPTAIRITALGTDAGPTMLSLNAAMSRSEPTT